MNLPDFGTQRALRVRGGLKAAAAAAYNHDIYYNLLFFQAAILFVVKHIKISLSSVFGYKRLVYFFKEFVSSAALQLQTVCILF